MGVIIKLLNQPAALQNKRKRTMGIKDRLKRAFRPPWARAEKGSDSEPPQPEKLEVSVTRSITQETAPIIRAPSPLAPAATDLTVATGILGETTPKQPFLSVLEISGEPFTMSSAPSRLDISESLPSHNMQSPSEVSPMNNQDTAQPLANQVGNIISSESTSEDNDSVSPMSQITIHLLPGQLDNIPSLDLTNRYESDPDACYFCKHPYSDSDDGEPKVFLPCGHSFGAKCLFLWFCRGLSVFITSELPFAHIRCPHDCIQLRHLCGHLVIPHDFAPPQPHIDASAIAIPSVYEFCGGRGSKLSRAIKRFHSLEKALWESDRLPRRGKRGKILDVLSFRRPPFKTQLFLFVHETRLKGESDLHREHCIWWLHEWGKRLGVSVQDSVFLTHHPWEAELRRKMLRDLAILDP